MARSEMAKKRQKERSDNSCDGPQLSAQEKKQRAELSELEIEEQHTFAPILHRLAKTGFPAKSLEDFSERYSPLPSAAVEILLVSIPEFGGDERAKEMIVRELADVAEPFEGERGISPNSRRGGSMAGGQSGTAHGSPRTRWRANAVRLAAAETERLDATDMLRDDAASFALSRAHFSSLGVMVAR